MKSSKYNFILYSDKYGYWYNAITGNYFRLSIFLSKKIEEFLKKPKTLKEEAPIMYDKLLKSGFIIDNDFDEINFITDKYNEAIHSKDYFLVILPTLNCNYKCWYCIQEHIPSLMSENVILAIKKHIDYMIDEKKITSLHIDWFGGEPFMFFEQVIVPISRHAIKRCEEQMIPFSNSSTTNGYFLSKKTSDSLTDLKFEHFQITLDGDREFHDKVKFIKGCNSTFDYVLRNIDYLLSVNPTIRVHLRINYTHSTLTKRIVLEVSKFIRKENRPRVIITPKKVWQEKTDKLFGLKLKEIIDDFSMHGFKVSRRDIITTFTSCYVNREFYNCISYNGNALKCTACDDIHKDNTYGKLLDNGKIFWENEHDKKCQEPSFNNKMCLNCKLLPNCMGRCPRDFIAGVTKCKYESIDNVFERDLLDFLINEFK